MKRILLTLFSFCAFLTFGWGQISYNIVDDFNRSDNQTLGTTSSGYSTWTEYEPVGEEDQLSISGNVLVAITSGVTGYEPTGASINLSNENTSFDLGNVTSGWSFHFDLNDDPSGWTTTYTSLGWVLVANEADFTSKTIDGYAVVWNGTGNQLVLTQFSDGISNSTNVGTTIIDTYVDWDGISTDGMNVRIEVSTTGIWTMYWEEGTSIGTPTDIDANNLSSSLSTTLFEDANMVYSGPIWSHPTGSQSGSFDNFTFGIGTGSSVASPSSFTATTTSQSQIDLSWALNGNSDNVIVVASADDDVSWSPTDGNNYSLGTVGSDELIYKGSGTSYNHSGLNASTYYYYKAWSVDASNNYSNAVSDNAPTLANRPSNPANSLSVTGQGYASIDLSWAYTDGADGADGFLLFASTADDISAPTDGTWFSEDIDLSDGAGQVIVNSGSTTYTWNGLDVSTNYFFAIYSYANQNTDVLYNTTSSTEKTSGTTATLPALVINEVHGDPSATLGDANGDGTINSSNDEFVELYNNSAIAINLSGYELHDAVGLKHLFPEGTYIQPYDYLVVFGGLTPTGFDNLDVQVASSGSLALNNAGETITIYNSTGILVITETFGSEIGNDESLVRDPLATGSFVKHSVATGASGALFSPGKNIDGTFAKTPTVWTGASDNSWSTSGNWSSGVPGTNNRVFIPNAANDPTISAATDCNSLVLESDATLLGAENLTINGTATVKRSLSVGKWQYFTPPTTNATANDIEITTSGQYAYLLKYNNDIAGSGTDLQLGWEYITSDKTALTAGKGYGVWVTEAKEINFTGSLVTGNQTISGINSGDSGNNTYVFVGNSALAHIDWTTISDDDDITTSAYFYDAANSRNATITQAGGMTNTSTTLIPPLQGFFVQVDASGDGNLTLPTSALTHGSQAFYKSQSIQNNKVRLAIQKGEYSDEALIYFDKNAINNYDARFDAHKLLITSPGIPQLYTQTDDHKLAINVLNEIPADIPLCIQSTESAELNLKVLEIENFDEGIAVSLEDRQTNKVYDLSATANIQIQVETGDNAKRFVLHYKSTALSVNDQLNVVKIYSFKNKIIVNRSSSIPAQMQVYSMNGQLIKQSVIRSCNSEIDTQLPNGFYMVKLTEDQHQTIRKITLNY